MKLPINKLVPNPNNPRTIKDDKFKKLVQSLKVLPIMLSKRPVLIDENNMIIGGNMRFRAAKEAGIVDIPVEIFTRDDANKNNKIAKALDSSYVDKSYEEQREEMIIKDNVSGGEWDWDLLANEWDTELLTEWGLDMPVYDEPDIDLPDGEKDGFQQMTFTLTDEQAETVKLAISKSRDLINGNEQNDNSNGNALFYIAKDYYECS